MENKELEKYYKTIIENWQEIVDFSYNKKITEEGNKIITDEKSVILSIRPYFIHIRTILMKYHTELTKEKANEIILNLIDYNRLVLYQKHIRLGKKGIEDYLRYGETKNYWNMEKMLNLLKEKNIKIFSQTPEELKKMEEEREKKLKKKNNNNNNDNNDDTNDNDEHKEDEDNTISQSTSHSVVNNIKKEENSIRLPSLPQKMISISSQKQQQQQQQQTYMSDSSQVMLKKDQSSLFEQEISNTQKEQKLVAQSISSEENSKNNNFEMMIQKIKMDEEYLYILNILLKIKEKYKGHFLKEEQIYNEAIAIDPTFAIKFFKRVFRITPFFELLNLKPSGYLL